MRLVVDGFVCWSEEITTIYYYYYCCRSCATKHNAVLRCAPGCASLKCTSINTMKFNVLQHKYTWYHRYVCMCTYSSIYVFIYTRSTRHIVLRITWYIFRGVLAVEPNADHPTRTRTLWGDLCLDAVVCEDSRLIRTKGDMLWVGGAHFKTRAPGCTYKCFQRQQVRRRLGKSEITFKLPCRWKWRPAAKRNDNDDHRKNIGLRLLLLAVVTKAAKALPPQTNIFIYTSKYVKGHYTIVNTSNNWVIHVHCSVSFSVSFITVLSIFPVFTVYYEVVWYLVFVPLVESGICLLVDVATLSTIYDSGPLHKHQIDIRPIFHYVDYTHT